ncbi:hypothetical protein EPIB1_1127 [Tritonibacter mobilis]|nr:hypothetical protein EPIB1_1127 [Tritonibacter mobilis]
MPKIGFIPLTGFLLVGGSTVSAATRSFGTPTQSVVVPDWL